MADKTTNKDILTKNEILEMFMTKQAKKCEELHAELIKEMNAEIQAEHKKFVTNYATELYQRPIEKTRISCYTDNVKNQFEVLTKNNKNRKSKVDKAKWESYSTYKNFVYTTAMVFAPVCF